jgi:hypothetical protein
VGLLDALKSLLRPTPKPPGDVGEATVTPGEVFTWHADARITAIDEVTLALPAAILEKDTPIGQIIEGPDSMGIALPGVMGNDANRILLRLRPGEWAVLHRSAQAQVMGPAGARMRVRVSGLEAIWKRAKASQ